MTPHRPEKITAVNHRRDPAAEQSGAGRVMLSKDAIADVIERLRPGDFIVRRIRNAPTTPF